MNKGSLNFLTKKTKVKPYRLIQSSHSYHTNKSVSLIGDCGATDIMLRQSDATVLMEDVTPCRTFEVGLPNGESICSIGHGTINIGDNVNAPAFVFTDSDLQHSLLGLSPLTNEAGCSISLDKESIVISRDNKVIAQGRKLPTEKLWKLQLQKSCEPALKERPSSGAHMSCQPHGQANSGVRLQTDGELVAFAYESFGSPVVSTFIRAARLGYLSTYPKITPKMIAAHNPSSIQSAKGHLDQSRQGTDSTKLKPVSAAKPGLAPPITTMLTTDTDMDGSEEEASEEEEPTDCMYSKLVANDNDNHSDATGMFPCKSRSGFLYLLISVMDGYVHMEPQRDRSAKEYIRTYSASLDFFDLRRRPVSTQRLDNETSSDLEAMFRARQVTFGYVPAHSHRRNRAERAIRAVKNHLTATLVTANDEFPMNMWDKMLPQAELTINCLRACRSDNSKSAYEGMIGNKFDFRAHSIAPFGTKVLVHEKPDQRKSWDVHGKEGFYLGPALEHYRCWHVYVTATRAERIADTLAWFPDRVKMPGTSSVDLLHSAVTDVSTALSKISAEGLLRAGQRTAYDARADTAVSALADLASLLSPPEPHTESIITPPSVPTPSEAVAANETVITSTVPPFQVQATMDQPMPVTNDAQPAPTGYTRSGAGRVRQANRRNRDQGSASTAQPLQRVAVTAECISKPTSLNQETRSFIGRHRGVALYAAQLFGTRRRLKSGSANAALNLDERGRPLKYRSAINGPNRNVWLGAGEIELDKLHDTGTINAVHYSDIPRDRIGDITYYNPQVKEKPDGEGGVKHRVRGTIGGDRINYPGAVAAKTAELEVVKLLLNSVMSDKNGKFMTCDITDFYLGTPLPRKEYLRIPVQFISPEIMERRGLQKFIHNGAIYFEVSKGMYGLPQAGLLAQERLVAHLAEHGYTQSKNVPCLFTHASNGLTFTLVVDDFGIKYTDRANAQHLLDCLQLLYPITVDWTGSKYLNIAINFAADRETLTLSMPGYVNKQILRFRPGGSTGAKSPGIYVPPVMGVQNAVDDTSRPLTAAEIKWVQGVNGAFLYYARVIDSTMLTAVNDIATDIGGQPTLKLLDQANRLLDYAATYPDNELVYRRSDMILEAQCDASYLSRSGARSVAGGAAYLVCANDPSPSSNGLISCLSKIIDCIVASVAEAEYAGVFKMGQHLAWLRIVCEALGHPQTKPTRIWCDNVCAVGLCNDTLKLKRSKSIDMRFHWVRDRVRQGQFTVEWQAGANNLADFFTKALSVGKHQEMMRLLVRIPPSTAARLPRARRGEARLSIVTP